MLYALRDPLSFVVLAASFVVAVTLAGWVQSLLAAQAGAPPEDPRRRRPQPRAHVDPFGAVAAALTGVGWAALLVGFGAVAGQVEPDTTLLQQGAGILPAVEQVLLLAGLVHLFVGLLSLVPLPPLDGGRLLFARAPRTPSWQKAELYLVEKNLGTVAVLVLLLLPLAGQLPLLLALLSAVGGPLVRLLTGVL